MSRMLDEIRQQPETLSRILAAELRGFTRFKASIERKKPRLVVLAARGTSDNAAQFGRYLIEITTGIPVSLAAPSVHTVYGARVNYKDALVVGLSQSGESTDINIVLEAARKSGALTAAITNEPRSAIARVAEYVFQLRAGPEKSVAATKTYTAQLMVLYLLAWALGAKIRVEDLRKIADFAAIALTLETEVSAMAERYRFMHHAVVVGRGLNYSSAFEFALKIDGDFLRDRGTLLVGGFSARTDRHGGAELPGISVRPFRADLDFHAGDAGPAQGVESGNRGFHGPAQSASRRACFAADFHPRAHPGDLFPHSLHHSRPDVRGGAGNGEESRSGPPARARQDHAHDLGA